VTRRAYLLIALAGCDAVFGIDLPSHDEDGDLVDDSVDLCPHLAGDAQVDSDGDGIGDDCDLDPSRAGDHARLYTFRDGIEDLLVSGQFTHDAERGAIELGALTGEEHALLSPVTTSSVLIDVGVTVLENALETQRDEPWAEVLVVSVHRAFSPGSDDRGDACFYGRDHGPDGDDVLPVYLQANQDEVLEDFRHFAQQLDGVPARVRHARGGGQTHCVVTRDDARQTHAFDEGRTATGTFGVGTVRLRARLDYLWVVTPPDVSLRP